MISQTPILLAGLTTCLLLIGGAKELDLAGIDRIEFESQPYSWWEYLGTRGKYHIIQHQNDERYRIASSTFKVANKKEKQRLTVAVREGYIRFGLPDQKHQKVPYRSPLKWIWNPPAFKELEPSMNRNRPKRVLWDSYVLYADRLNGNEASGNVYVEEKPPRKKSSEVSQKFPPPGKVYADHATLSADGKVLTFQGGILAQWSRAIARSNDPKDLFSLSETACQFHGDFDHINTQQWGD